LTKNTSSELLFRKIVAYRESVADVYAPEMQWCDAYTNVPTVSEGCESSGECNSIAEPPFFKFTPSGGQSQIQSNALSPVAGEQVFESRACSVHRFKIDRKNAQAFTGIYYLGDTAINPISNEAGDQVLQAMNGGALHFDVEFPSQIDSTIEFHGPWRGSGEALGFRWFHLSGVPVPVSGVGSNGSQTMLCIRINKGPAAYPATNRPAATQPTFNNYDPQTPLGEWNSTQGPPANAGTSLANDSSITLPGGMFMQLWRLNGGRPLLVGTYYIMLNDVTGTDVNGNAYPPNTCFIWIGANPATGCTASKMINQPVGWNIGGSAPYPTGLTTGTTSTSNALTATPANNVIIENVFSAPDHWMVTFGGEPALQIDQMTFTACWETSCAYVAFYPADSEVGQTMVEGGMERVLSANTDFAEVAEGQYQGGIVTYAEMNNLGDEDRLRIRAMFGAGMMAQLLDYRGSFKNGKMVDGLHIWHKPHKHSDLAKFRQIALVDWNSVPPALLDLCALLLDRPAYLVCMSWQSNQGNGAIGAGINGAPGAVTTGQTGDILWSHTTVRERLLQRKGGGQVVPRGSLTLWDNAMIDLRDVPAGWSRRSHRQDWGLNPKTGKRQAKEAALFE
jgi:hypothetical protein